MIILLSWGVKTILSFNLTFECTNNLAEYETLVIDLKITLEFGIKDVRVSGNSQLLLHQLIGEYKCWELNE